MGYTFRNNDLLLGRYSGSFFKEQVITPNSGSIILFDKNLNPSVVTTSSLYFNRLSASKLNVNSASIKYITSSIIDVSKRIVSRGPIQLFPTKDNNFPQVTSSFIYTSGSTNDIFFTHYHGTDKNTTRLSWIEGNLYTGLLNGGILTATTGGSKFNLSGGKGIIVTLNASTSSLSQVSPDPNIKYVTWPTYTNVNLTYISSSRVTYIGIDNTGAIIQQTVPWSTNDVNQYDSQLFLGVVAHLNGNKVTTAYNTPQTAYGISQKSDEFFRAFGPLKISGHTLYPSSSAVTLKLRKTSGKSYLDGANYIYNASHPDVIDDSALNVSKIYRYYISGSTPVVDSGTNGAGYTDIDPTKYVDTAGTLSSVPGGKITLQRVFWVPKNPVNSLLIYYGNTLYNSLDSAISNKDDEPFTEAPETAENAIFVAWIAIEGGATNLNDTSKVRIAQGGLFRNVGGIGGGGTTPFSNTLAGLSDVAISSPALGDLLVYGSGTQWNNTKTLNGTYTINSLSVTSSLNVNGNTRLGDSNTDTLRIYATSQINGPLSASKVRITGSSVFSGPITGSGAKFDIVQVNTSIKNPTGNVALIPYNYSATAGSGSVDIYGGLNWIRKPGDSPTEIGELVSFASTMGLINGGAISSSVAGGLVVQVNELVGYTMFNTPYATHTLQKLSTYGTTDASRQITIPANSAQYIYYAKSGASLVLSYAATAPSTRTNIVLGRVVTDSSKIIYIDDSPIDAHHYSNYIDRLFREAMGPIFSTGAIVTENVTPLKLNVTAGVYFFSEHRITTSGGTPITLDGFYRSGASWLRTPGITSASNKFYDPNSGSLQSIPANKFTKHSLYLLGGLKEKYLLVYGQNSYDTKGDASAALKPTPPSYFTDAVVNIASLVVTPQSSSIISIIDERPRLGFASPSVTGVVNVHGDLLGLLSDDHPQYLLTNGGRSMGGNLDLGDHNINNILTASGSKITFGQITGSELRVNGDIRLGTTTLIQPTKSSPSSDGYNLSIFGGNGNGSTQTGGDLILRGGYGVDGSGSVRLVDNVVIGDTVANQDSLTVYSTTNFVGKISGSSIRITGNTTIGDASSDTVNFNATSTFNAPATFNNSVTFNQLTGSISGSKARFGQLTGSELRVNGDVRFSPSNGSTTLLQPTRPPTTGISGYTLSIFGGDAIPGSTDPGGDLILRGGYGPDGSGSVRLRDSVVIGDVSANQDTLTVYSTTNFVGKISGSSIRITGNTVIGDAASDTLKILASTTFNGPLTSSGFRSNGRLHVSSSASSAAFIVSTINQGSLNETNATLIVTGSKVGINTDDVDYNLEVNGSFAATTKSFVIDYKDKPGSKLVHASLEGPEHGVYVRGNTTSSKVFLPDYWNWLVNENNINVQLTSNRRYQELFVENIILNESSSYFTVKERGIKGWLNRLFKKPVNFSYVVHAERKDVPPLKTEIKKRKTKKKY